jgi:hypothetical protein
VNQPYLLGTQNLLDNFSIAKIMVSQVYRVITLQVPERGGLLPQTIGFQLHIKLNFFGGVAVRWETLYVTLYVQKPLMKSSGT